MKIKSIASFSCMIMLISLFSCMTVPKESEISADATAADLAQKAQEAFDSGNRRAARVYYETILKRFPDDESACIAAQYEIAHLHIKKRQWKDAYTILEKIIAKYEGPMAMHLPPDYYKLAKIDYTRAAEKLRIKTKQ
jgi:tetratricopeptide repeat domain protein